LHASDGQWSRWGVQPLGLRDLFENTDAVCVQMSYYNRYRGLLGERALPYCRQGQVLVSVSPLALFNEEVLADVLKSGRMAAAWLDSMGPGSLDPGQPLHNARGLLVTPRLAAYTREARLRSAWGVARRIDEILRTSNVKNPARGISTNTPSANTASSANSANNILRSAPQNPPPQQPVHTLAEDPVSLLESSMPLAPLIKPSHRGYRNEPPLHREDAQPTRPIDYDDEKDMLFRQNEMQQIFQKDLLFRNTVSPDAEPAPAPVREST
jgi:hypothetical protein